jgi:hypothetical protein
MSKTSKILIFTFISVLVVLFTCEGCASTKKNVVISKSKDSMCDLSRLGKNKYFYSNYYQKKLTKSVKKIGGQ